MLRDLNTFISINNDNVKRNWLSSQENRENGTVATSFKLWSLPGYFDADLAKGPKTTGFVWDFHSSSHDFETQKNR